MQTDDIVTRLREITCENRWCGNDPHCRICDAADDYGDDGLEEPF
jgi:hypothetical protein